jgi:hypothetical protein
MRLFIYIIAIAVIASITPKAAYAADLGRGYEERGAYIERPLPPPRVYYGGPAYWGGPVYWGAPSYWGPGVYWGPRFWRPQAYCCWGPRYYWGPRWGVRAGWGGPRFWGPRWGVRAGWGGPRFWGPRRRW